MFTTNNIFIAQLIAILNRGGWSMEVDTIEQIKADPPMWAVLLQHSDGRQADGILRDDRQSGYELYIAANGITHQEALEHVEYCATDHLPIVQAARSS